MATTKGRISLSLLAAALVAAPAFAASNERAARAESRIHAMRADLGLDQDHAFALRASDNDGLGQTHSRFQQTYKGVKVFGGEVIMHMDKEGAFLPATKAHHAAINLNVAPSMTATEALAVAHRDLAPTGGYVVAPSAELVVFPETHEIVHPGLRHVDRELNAEDMTRQVVRHTLAYHVSVQLENGANETIHRDYIINAHTGAIVKSWDNLHSAGVKGTGNSQFSGTVTLDTNSTTSGYEMRDMLRGTGGTFGNNVVTNLNHSTSGNGTIYTDADNTWGDGTNYTGSTTSTTGATGQTAAVDAAYGIQWTWDYFKNVLGRNGIDGTGKASYLRVHYSTSYDNAFWSDACFCMTFGDGSSFKSLESIDVAGHEMSHGVCATTANLTYSGESGGLNEANSDIHGTMVEFYAHGGGTTTVPATGGNWTIGEQLSTPSFPTPLRYMYKPSKDGSSPDAWSSTIGSLDVHYSSGPSNRAFYFLSQGSSNVSSSDFYSTYLPGGMTGVGNDHAARIAFRALSVYMTSSTNYAGARTAYINAAKDLYGAGSVEEQAVWNAFAAINVGSAWSNGAPVITGQPANASVQAGATATFTVTATGSGLSYQWKKNGTAISGATAASYTTPATTTADSGSTFAVTVSNTGGSVTSNNATLTVTTLPPPPPGNAEVEPNNSSSTAQVVSTSGTTINAKMGSSTDVDYFKVTLGAGRTITATMTPNASSDYDLYVYNSNLTQIGSSENGTGSVDSVSVKNNGTSAFARYVKVIYYSGLTGASGTYTLKLTF